MNIEHFNEWLDELDRTDKVQGKSALACRVGSEQVRYCCLGIAELLAGAKVDEIENMALPMGDRFRMYYGVREGNFTLDAPRGLVDRDGYDFHGKTASSMNDGDMLTFKQIAQMFRYFGAKEW